MKTHSSGVPMFFGIYSVCLMLIGCLFLLKYDATRIRSDEMIVPTTRVSTPARKPIRLVQMNPIKKYSPKKLLRPSTAPNVFIAVVPANEPNVLVSFAENQIGIWRMVFDFGKSISAFSFPIIPEQNGWAAKEATVASAESYVNMDSRKFQSASFSKSIVLPKSEPVSFFEALEPNVWLANDFETKDSIESEIAVLERIGVNSDELISIRSELENVWTTAAYDSGDAEASLYRMLGEVHNLSLNNDAQNAEDLRVLDAAKDRIINSVYLWIDILNGDVDKGIESLQLPEIDFRKLNTAIRTMFGQNWF